jgi:hypothetical protein
MFVCSLQVAVLLPDLRELMDKTLVLYTDETVMTGWKMWHYLLRPAARHGTYCSAPCLKDDLR